uniref:Uncharacterized protein n=1 Tax=Timema bartmani TaxID=61472 RepID=A0A7R9HZB7_9NEOP|nr:unnamed protein product [Timema bartmani]
MRRCTTACCQAPAGSCGTEMSYFFKAIYAILDVPISKSELEKCKTDYKSDSTQAAASSLESSPSSSLDVVDSTDIKEISKRNDGDESSDLLKTIVIMLEGIQHDVARNNEKPSRHTAQFLRINFLQVTGCYLALILAMVEFDAIALWADTSCC